MSPSASRRSRYSRTFRDWTANRIQRGVAREVFSLIENGVAEPADIDKALKFGPAFRYATTGQLEVADFGGLDIWCVVGDNLLKKWITRRPPIPPCDARSRKASWD